MHYRCLLTDRVLFSYITSSDFTSLLVGVPLFGCESNQNSSSWVSLTSYASLITSSIPLMYVGNMSYIFICCKQ
ncbi:hypothetical protein BC629DRAFT_1501473 [Irpex lacteus]|nr:hypothetical protein BC629DRAFT_1550956 [Irpex lacteus]KAI0798642.1 hypothetical protein BC629DRAFT_1501473 [Irpex lacteus]